VGELTFLLDFSSAKKIGIASDSAGVSRVVSCDTWREGISVAAVGKAIFTGLQFPSYADRRKNIQAADHLITASMTSFQSERAGRQQQNNTLQVSKQTTVDGMRLKRRISRQICSS
jgi:hypothetical protein